MPVNVGIDLVAVDEVEEAVAVHGERYLSRIFTERERRESGGDPRRLAARFAAKEATMKALGRGDEGIGWRCIAVAADLNGIPTIEFQGEAARIAEARGVCRLRFSLTDTQDHAAAVVLLETRA
jgi:holo-[acyl-carrier protein] synthase